MFRFRNRLFVYRRLLMVGTKSHGYSNSGRLSEGEYSMPFFCTSHSPTFVFHFILDIFLIMLSNYLEDSFKKNIWVK